MASTGFCIWSRLDFIISFASFSFSPSFLNRDELRKGEEWEQEGKKGWFGWQRACSGHLL